MKLIFQEEKTIAQDELDKLYSDVGWSAYTHDLPCLQNAVARSLTVITARDSTQLVGLIRVVGDGLTIIYIQDILVLRAYQNQHIGTDLLQRILEKYRSVRQKVLLTVEAPNTRRFYEKNNFTSCDNGVLVAFSQCS